MSLFSSLKVREIELKNRIVVSPMCQYSSEDGFANDWHLVHLGSRAVGGAALVFTEAAAVTAEGRISPQDLGIWKAAHIDYLARIVRFVKAHGAVAGTQLAHAGRKASTSPPWDGGEYLSESQGGWRPIFAPSPIAFSNDAISPESLDQDGVQHVVQSFADAATRALAAGFEVVELHAAHGYLLHEFLSPLSNHRSDQYGGSFHNRVRLVCEVVEAVRKVWPERLPLFVRLSATDWRDDGWTPDDSVALSKMLKPLGVDLMDCSSGGVVPGVRIPTAPGYQVPFAAKIKHQASILTGAVGLITDSSQADGIINRGEADLVFLARQMLRDPYWPLHAAKELGVSVRWPDQYLRARD